MTERHIVAHFQSVFSCLRLALINEPPVRWALMGSSSVEPPPVTGAVSYSLDVQKISRLRKHLIIPYIYHTGIEESMPVR